jgi:outer membrane scaffolding protein for murein synthesis (MipA/OmpV family)
VKQRKRSSGSRAHGRYSSILWVLFALGALGAHFAHAQTPSPIQEWQYPGGITLERLFEPKSPEWRVIAGVGMSLHPAYTGSSVYLLQEGPAFNILYRNVAFFSAGEGLGVNLIEGRHYRISLALGLDMGRRTENNIGHLYGLRDIGRAPYFKLSAAYAISRRVPIVLRADVRRIVGGASGYMGDLEFFLPLPGSSKKLAMFVGPSVTFADAEHMRTTFGVTQGQADASGLPVYLAHGGLEAAGIGFSATRFVTHHVLLNMDTAVNHLFGSAAASPITQRRTQAVVTFTAAYQW